jgi:hypothetical protein
MHYMQDEPAFLETAVLRSAFLRTYPVLYSLEALDHVINYDSSK